MNKRPYELLTMDEALALRFRKVFPRSETPEQQAARKLRAEIHAHNLTVELKRKQRKGRNK